jgi:hypothetical protein
MAAAAPPEGTVTVNLYVPAGFPTDPEFWEPAVRAAVESQAAREALEACRRSDWATVVAWLRGAP